MSSTSASAPSSSPSSSAFNFPTFLPRKEQPNTHPYAIQTSSTAILTRCNSTSAHASVGPHHYIPMSPSPPSPQHSPTKLNRPNRHRYSQSLTSDQPPPLPPPPGAASNQMEDNTPRKRVHRAETLPSSAGPPLQNLDLPDDPKSWTPSQLSMYLSASLRSGDVNLLAPVAKDISKFVNDRGITGKTFLRLSEDDLQQFGINQLWRSTLLTASRGLRQTMLRGRIWGFGYTPPNEEDNASSNISSNRHKAPRRSRHLSLTSDHGKVKDLVQSLEKLSPTRPGPISYGYDMSDDSDNGDPSVKYAKRMSARNESFSSNHHHHHPSTPSPSKSHRSLPPRGTVNDLFTPPMVDPDIAVRTNEGDTTIKNVARHNVNGREARMLPVPPTQAPMIAPMHTGSCFPLPLSPEHSGTAYSQHVADYEMGFRSRTHSPYSQVFVVRHNPASPSNSLHVEANNKRLLPLPPVTGETHLHHPKPRRLVGNIDDANVTEGSPNAKGDETNGVTDSTTSGTEGVLETPNDIKGVSSHSTINGGHKEPTMQELVASVPASKPISGVEAWELDLGETVKRIGRDIDDHDFRRGSVSEIGRKAGKHPTAPRSSRDATDVSKRGHILGLFDPPKEDTNLADEVDNSSETADLQERKSEAELHLREQHLSDKEQTVAERERDVSEREQVVTQKERAITEREKAIQRWEVEVERREGAVSVRERGLIDRQVLEVEQWSAKQKEIQEQTIGVEDRQRLLQVKQQTLEDKELNITTREERIREREVEMRMWEKRIQAKEEELNEKISAAALAASESSWPVPVNILRKCWRMLGMDDSTTVDSIAPGPHQTDPRAIRRDILFGPSRSGGYLVLMSIGVCVVALRVLGKFRRR